MLSVEHLAAVAAVALACVVVPVAARRRPGPWIDLLAKILAVVILVAELSWYVVYLPLQGNWSASYGLPLQLCDVAGFIAPAALWWRQWLLVELTYFWGLGGTIQALITPDLREHFPSYPYWQFYLTHGAIVLAAVFLTAGIRAQPRPLAVLRIFLLTLGFTVTVALVDLMTGGNYMYLRQPPLNGSLLNVMGPWPWYIATGTLLAMIVLAVLDAPFWPARRRARRVTLAPAEGLR